MRGQNDVIRFNLNGREVLLQNPDPNRTVLQYLREDCGLTGTKEGCAEGDCGACTVVLADGDGQDATYRAVNSCIKFLPTLDGESLYTVEGLADGSNNLNPVQDALVNFHASQCGFCTPGFVMSLFALFSQNKSPDRRDIDIALSGNLCRCTGYRPIVDAALSLNEFAAPSEPLPPMESRTKPDHESLEISVEDKWFAAPTTLDELSSVVVAHPDAVLLAGGTDIGLWVTKQYRVLEKVIYLGQVDELKSVSDSDDNLDIGSMVSLTEAALRLTELYPELAELFDRFASPPIRNVATLGGNIANGSPIGDSMPVLIALGTQLRLRCGIDSRLMALEEFYLDYQETALEQGEFIERILIPKRGDDHVVRSYKVSKRFDQDISAICAGFSLRLSSRRVDQINIVFGGMAGIPLRARATENFLSGKEWCESNVISAAEILAQEYEPLSDMRASSAYRRQASANLLRRFYEESVSPATLTNVYSFGREP